jgi:hypothetical protein
MRILNGLDLAPVIGLVSVVGSARLGVTAGPEGQAILGGQSVAGIARNAGTGDDDEAERDHSRIAGATALRWMP